MIIACCICPPPDWLTLLVALLAMLLAIVELYLWAIQEEDKGDS